MEIKKMSLGGARGIALSGLLFATSILLAAVENSIPPIPNLIPGIKLGLSNIVVMYALLFLSKGQAYTIAVLKAAFVFITRGTVAFILSICGGLTSLTAMILFIFLSKKNDSYLLISTIGAVFHNVGQYFAFCILYTYLSIWAYLPILIIAGIIAGVATSKLLSVILPALKKLGFNIIKEDYL